jgi:hypothetical protein
MEETASQLQL